MSNIGLLTDLIKSQYIKCCVGGMYGETVAFNEASLQRKTHVKM